MLINKTKHQFGFSEKLSTYLASLKFTNNITEELDKKSSTIGIFLDLTKAFDTIENSSLLEKLNYYGIRDTALGCLKSYLTDRTQYVCNDGINF